MSFRLDFTLAALTAVVLTAGPVAAAAQTTTLSGAPVAGVCVLSQAAVFATSKVGQATTARLRELAQGPVSSLSSEREAIVTDAKALVAAKPTLSSVKFEARQDAIQQRDRAVQGKLQTLQRQIDATQQKADGQIAQAAQPILAQVYQAHGCGLLLSREAVLGGNMTNDLTAAVVQGLDAKMTTISFDLEPSPAPGAPGASQ